jgi:acetyltransferase
MTPEATRPARTAAELLAAYGIQTVPLILAGSPAEAKAASRQQGFPIVMKIASPDILHKSDVDGVVLDVQNANQAASAYTHLVKSLKDQFPTAQVQGVWVQKQILGGQDVIVGAVCDPNFGPLMMFGSGGVEAEGLGDVAFALAPLERSEADELMRRTWAGRRLDGFRNIAAADKSAVRDALVALSWLAHDHPEVKEIEINPLRVLAKGAFALDVRMSLRPTVSTG